MQNNATESPGGKFVILFGKCALNNMRHYGKESSNKKPFRLLFEDVCTDTNAGRKFIKS